MGGRGHVGADDRVERPNVGEVAARIVVGRHTAVVFADRRMSCRIQRSLLRHVGMCLCRVSAALQRTVLMLRQNLLNFMRMVPWGGPAVMERGRSPRTTRLNSVQMFEIPLRRTGSNFVWLYSVIWSAGGTRRVKDDLCGRCHGSLTVRGVWIVVEGRRDRRSFPSNITGLFPVVPVRGFSSSAALPRGTRLRRRSLARR